MLIVIISLCISLISAENITEKTNQKKINIYENEENKISDSNIFFSTLNSQMANNQGIEFLYPKTGYFYNRNTVGSYKALLSILNCCFVVGNSLEADVQTSGSVDKVTFTLKPQGQQIDDTSSDNGKFTCKFQSFSSSFGVYEITADGYYQGSKVCTATVSKVLFLKIGTGGNRPPIAVANFESIVWENEEVAFDASTSYDPDGTIVSYQWDFGDGHTSNEIKPTHIYKNAGKYTVILTVTDNEGATGAAQKEIAVIDYDFGVWITTEYNGNFDETKLDLTVDDFIDLLYGHVSHKTYLLTMQHQDDTKIELRFGKAPINGKSAIMSNLNVEVDQSTDLSKEYSVNLEFRFPYSLLNDPDATPSEEYFVGQIKYHYYGGLVGKNGPHDVQAWFYFGKDSLQDPGLLRMKIDPYPYGVEKLVPLSYETRFTTRNSDGGTAFDRTLSLEFNPAAEITITSVPMEGKINYNFGSETAGEITNISFRVYGGALSDILQRFIINPLPEYMMFDLTIIGERSFLYEASDSFDITWIVDSVQNGNLVKLELNDLPKRISVSWGLNINLAGKTASGFVDLDMYSNIGKIKLYLQGSSKPFIEINDFPKKLRVEGSINVPTLSGYVILDKYSGSTTTITVPLSYDKWTINAVLKIYDIYAKAEFDLPSSSSDSQYVMFGLDTNGKSMLGWDFSLVDTTTQKEVIEFNVGGIATEDLKISWNNNNGQIQNFKIQGKIIKFIDLFLSVDYQSVALDITGTWELSEGGSFLIKLNKPVDVTFVDMESDQFKLYGHISLYADRKLSINWQLSETGQFQIYTFGQAVGNNFILDFEYDPTNSHNYQYGFKMTGNNFLNITRTIMWNTQDRIIPRIWILGDKPLPGDWTTQVLWKGSWYNVPFP